MSSSHQNSLVVAAPPTLDEVAAAAGVSRSTASRAINGGLRVSPAAKTAVNAAARLLGYSPNRAAQTLATRRTNSIALVIPEPDERVLSDPFIGATLRGISAALSTSDKQLVLLIARPGEAGARIGRYLHSGQVDGALIVSHHRQDRLEDAVIGSGIPAVFVGRPFHNEDQLHYIDVDGFAGAQLATEHLISLGRRRIGHIAGPQDMTAGKNRASGWRHALQSAHLSTDHYVQGDFTTASGYESMNLLLGLDPSIDAVFAASDLIALGAVSALREHGKSVPNDIAIAGFDDLGGAANASPPLSTVRNPVTEMASAAVTKLMTLLDNKTLFVETPTPQVFSPKLITRESTQISGAVTDKSKTAQRSDHSLFTDPDH